MLSATPDLPAPNARPSRSILSEQLSKRAEGVAGDSVAHTTPSRSSPLPVGTSAPVAAARAGYDAPPARAPGATGAATEAGSTARTLAAAASPHEPPQTEDASDAAVSASYSPEMSGEFNFR